MSRNHPEIITGNIVDIFDRSVYSGQLEIIDGKVASITRLPEGTQKNTHLPYLLPGFIDAHVHIESSMLAPAQFARIAVTHGTVATVSDPHEIANVCGIEGVEFMITNGNTVPFKFNFGAPSCVPATVFETAGAALDVAAIKALLARPDIRYLSEMMNFPGVLSRDRSVMQKIAAANRLGKPVDGHAPGLRGRDAEQYVQAGISTDHECFTQAEALEKLGYGMKILVREGSAAKNFDALIDLMHEFSDRMMFCTDDLHPDSLVSGHINRLCARAVARGIDVFKVLRAACVNPVLNYHLDVGLLRPADDADFIIVKDLVNFDVLQTFINGRLVAEYGEPLFDAGATAVINNFNCSPKKENDFVVQWHGESTIPVIEAQDGQLITNKLNLSPRVVDGKMVSDTDRNVLKLAVVNRYRDAPVATAFIRNIRLSKGAIASSVAHDSHNIVAVGTSDAALCAAVNAIIEKKGGICCYDGDRLAMLELPVAGLMSNDDGYRVAKEYIALDAMAKSAGTSLAAPFMTLSFMALLVIPHLKLSDLGLFDGDAFEILQMA